jgi:hypothetical protein
MSIMKKIIYLLLGLLITFSSCKKEKEFEVNGEGKVAFSFNFNASQLKNSACDMSKVVSAVITVKTILGEATDYTSSAITIYKMNDRVFTQKIALEIGDYKVTEFLLVDAQGNVLYAVPVAGSLLGESVVSPLPLAIKVKKDLSQDYPIEVVCVDGFNPKDFGLTWFGIAEAQVCKFLLSVSELGSNQLLAGDVTVTGLNYNYTQTFSESVVPNVILIKCGLSKYTITIDVPGYEKWEKVLTAEEIAKYKDFPLVVELLPVACGKEYTTNLVLANGDKVGVVKVTPLFGSFLIVEYKITADDWYLIESAVSVTGSVTQIPLKSDGDADVAQFTYKTTHQPIATFYQFVNLPVNGLNNVVIAANAKVSKYLKDMALLENALPDNKVNVNVRFTGHPAYFETTITGAGALDGKYPGNCVDLEHGIAPGRNYSMSLVSSYTGDPDHLALLVDKPYNLDLVNYVINQDYSAYGATGAEIQASVWTLVDDITPTSGTGGITWNQNVVNFIIQDALANGEGFEPNCGQRAMIIVDPGVKEDPTLRAQVTLVQVTTIAVPNVCKPLQINEQAWAKGRSLGNGQAMYFNYCVK